MRGVPDDDDEVTFVGHATSGGRAALPSVLRPVGVGIDEYYAQVTIQGNGGSGPSPTAPVAAFRTERFRSALAVYVRAHNIAFDLLVDIYGEVCGARYLIRTDTVLASLANAGVMTGGVLPDLTVGRPVTGVSVERFSVALRMATSPFSNAMIEVTGCAYGKG